MSELLKRRGAEVGVEPLAIDRDCLELAEVRVAGYFVILIALISLQIAQLHSLGAAVEKIGVVVRVLGCNENHVNIGPVGRLEVCQAEHELSVSFLVDGRAAGSLVHFAVKGASFQSFGFSSCFMLSWANTEDCNPNANVSATSAKAVLMLRTITVSP